MKYWALMLCVVLVSFCSIKVVLADEPVSFIDENRVEAYIRKVYRQLNFSGADRLSYDVFAPAYRGYLNMRNAGALNTEREIISICDFSLPSTFERLWVIDLKEKRVLYNTYVAHGQGSGEVCAGAFSNIENSHQSSVGFYVTQETYNGDHGLSLRLEGKDNGFNDAAKKRGIVVHGAPYVSEQFICGNEKLGRSWGCPAIAESLKVPIINTIKEGTCLFIFYQDHNYLSSSVWINQRVTALPEPELFAQVQFPIKKQIKEVAPTAAVEPITTNKQPTTPAPPPPPKNILLCD